MKNNQQISTEAKNESPVSATDLLAELKPLLDDYFVGDISFDGNAITYCLPNGQKFCITVVAA